MMIFPSRKRPKLSQACLEIVVVELNLVLQIDYISRMTTWCYDICMAILLVFSIVSIIQQIGILEKCNQHCSFSFILLLNSKSYSASLNLMNKTFQHLDLINLLLLL